MVLCMYAFSGRKCIFPNENYLLKIEGVRENQVHAMM